MNASEPSPACEHEWRWLSRHEYAAVLAWGLGRPVNVQCVRCRARTWAHGHMPGHRPVTSTPEPHDTRS